MTENHLSSLISLFPISPITRLRCFYLPTWADGDFDHTYGAVMITSSFWFSNMWLDAIFVLSVSNAKEIHWKEWQTEQYYPNFLVRPFSDVPGTLLPRPGWHISWDGWWRWWSAILDLWRHFRPPSWICGDVTSGRHLGFVVTWFPVTWFPVTWLLITWLPHRKSRERKSRDHKSKMATGSDVTTNPRWRPEVTSQIQDGGPPPPPPVPRNVLPQLLLRWRMHYKSMILYSQKTLHTSP